MKCIVSGSKTLEGLTKNNRTKKSIALVQEAHNFVCSHFFAACTTLSCDDRIASEIDSR